MWQVSLLEQARTAAELVNVKQPITSIVCDCLSIKIRKAIYTTNAVESLNSVIRRVIKKRNVFPTDDSVFKVIWLAIKDASKKWTMPIQNWKLAMNRFMIDFGDRLDDHR
ncbi:transposase, Mutator family protein [Glaesserella parasuis 12939]|nr:transposase, Mutator family protein [Glaesserella parasuis 12939]